MIFVFHIIFVNVVYHLSAFQNGKQMVQEGALTALASVADSSQVLYSFILFQYFYRSFVVDVSSFFFCMDRSTSRSIMML